MWLVLLKDFYQDMKAQRLRALLTIISVTWGTIAVVLLLAFGNGLGHQLMFGLVNAGDKIMIIYGGETSKEFEGMAKGRQIDFVEEDVDMLEHAIPGIAMISPQYRKYVQLRYKKFSTNTECEGVNPNFEEMRRMYPMAGGRFLSSKDVQEQRRTLVLGSKIAKDIFGDEEPAGKALLLDGIPFTVVGIIQPKLQTSSNNGPDAERAIIPYNTFRTMYGNKYVNSIVIRPTDPGKQPAVKESLYRVLGRKYHFDPTDERALGIWDFIEEEKIGEKITLGITLFLFSVGFLTLLIAGVGVANVMYAIVKERTREIGVRMAVGAKRSHIMAQFLFQALLVAFIGGAIGLSFSYGVVAIVRMLPAETDGPMQFLGRPILSPVIMMITTGILTVIGIVAGLFPARRAANVDPIESLRYE